MKRDEILNLTGRDLDVLVAIHVLGYRWSPLSHRRKKGGIYPGQHCLISPVRAAEYLPEYAATHLVAELKPDQYPSPWSSYNLPHYSTSLDACREAEEALRAKMGDQFYHYGNEVSILHGGGRSITNLLMVTAEQKCRCMLLALKARL